MTSARDEVLAAAVATVDAWDEAGAAAAMVAVGQRLAPAVAEWRRLQVIADVAPAARVQGPAQ